MSTTPNQGLSLPDVGSQNNVPADMAAYNTGVENRLVQRYASAVDRGVRNPTPIKGEISYLSDVDRHEYFDGVEWRNTRGGATHFFLPGETGTTLLSFTSQTSHYLPVNFLVPFAAPPVVLCNISTGAGATSAWTTRAYNINTNGFTIYVQSVNFVNSTWSNVPIDWVAIARS